MSIPPKSQCHCTLNYIGHVRPDTEPNHLRSTLKFKGDPVESRAEEQRDLKRRHEFVRSILPNIEAQLKIVSQSYQDMVRTFLLQLACSQDQSLQFLSVRLDFNQHYKRKDARLGAPLTYQHRRLSSLD